MGVDNKKKLAGMFKVAEPAKTETKKAEFWLNVGVVTEVTVEGQQEETFVSIVGTVIDNLQVNIKNTKSESFAEIQDIRKILSEALLERAKDLEEGEAVILPLKVELRRAVIQEKQVISEDKRQDLVNSIFG